MSLEDWKNTTVGDIAEYVNGKAFKPTEWSEQGLPIIRIQNLTDPTKPLNRFDGQIEDRYLINDGDLLISWSASLGAYIWNRGPAVLNQHIFKVKPNRSLVDKEFLYFLVCHMLDDMRKHTHGSTMKHITKKKFEAMQVCIPALEEQRRIVGRIRELLDRVKEIKKLRIESLNEARQLENAVFGDFIVEYCQNQQAKSVALGEIILKAQYGTSTKGNTSGNGLPVLRMGNIKDGYLDLNDIKHVELPESETEKYLLNEGDILFNRTNSFELVGKAATARGLHGKWVFASYLVRLVVDPALALPDYVTAIINSRIGRQFVSRTARRAIGMVNINAKQIQGLEFPLPSIANQQTIIDTLMEAKRASDAVKINLDMTPLHNLTDSILRKAFTGEL